MSQKTIGFLQYDNDNSIIAEVITASGEYYFTFDNKGRFRGFWDREMKRPMNKREQMSVLRRAMARIKRNESKVN